MARVRWNRNHNRFFPIMKKILTIIATVSLLAITTASAHEGCESRRLVGYTECGTPIFATLEVVGYNHCGQPIMQWVTHYPRETEYRESYRDYDHHSSHHSSRHHSCR